MRFWKSSVMVGVAVLFLAGPTLAYHDDYDDSESDPLRVAAYILHPVGYTLEWLLFRPMHALVSQPDLEPISGHYRPHGWGFEGGGPQMGEATTVPAPAAAAPPAPVVSTADAEAARRAAEEARAAAEEAKRAAEEAARAAEKATRGFEKSLRK
jgi:pyruvate/2-oxoglutarate dehydrogenase complex dihydrolipoamide acyltransferase (E2) component